MIFHGIGAVTQRSRIRTGTNRLSQCHRGIGEGQFAQHFARDRRRRRVRSSRQYERYKSNRNTHRAFLGYGHDRPSRKVHNVHVWHLLARELTQNRSSRSDVPEDDIFV